MLRRLFGLACACAALRPAQAQPCRPAACGRLSTASLAHVRHDVSDDASISVYDARGTRVRELRSGFVLAGEHAVEWDGRDDAGRAVASGVYFCRLRSGGGEAIRKLVLVR